MRKQEKIIGLPVIDLSSGKQVGKVWDIIIDGDKGAISYFIIDDGMIILGAKVICVIDVAGIGDNAITIKNQKVLRPMDQVAEAIEHYKKNIKVKNTDVLTQRGKVIGKIGEVYFEDDDFSIAAVEFLPLNEKGKAGLIHKKAVLAYGEKLVVIADSFQAEDDEKIKKVEKKIEEKEEVETKSIKIEELKQEREMVYTEPVEKKSVDITRAVVQAEPKNNQKHTVDFAVSAVEDELSLLEVPVSKPKAPENKSKIANANADKSNLPEMAKLRKQEKKNDEFEEGIVAKPVYKIPAKENESENKSKQHEKPKSSDLFEQKQREFLLGRKVTKIIKDKYGEVILNTGEAITNEAMDKAKQSGRFIELVINNRP